MYDNINSFSFSYYELLQFRKHFEQSIESILNQTYENIEFLIINDASTDSTFEILK